MTVPAATATSRPRPLPTLAPAKAPPTAPNKVPAPCFGASGVIQALSNNAAAVKATMGMAMRVVVVRAAVFMMVSLVPVMFNPNQRLPQPV